MLAIMADRQRLETYQYMNTISGGLKRLHHEMNFTTSIERTLDLISLRSKVPWFFFSKIDIQQTIVEDINLSSYSNQVMAVSVAKLCKPICSFSCAFVRFSYPIHTISSQQLLEQSIKSAIEAKSCQIAEHSSQTFTTNIDPKSLTRSYNVLSLLGLAITLSAHTFTSFLSPCKAPILYLYP
uniref:Uncharacterized protein n=1 Tax=Helianthus annuus TaxID=4232 RepID=A0A251SBN1_HELAN